MSKYKYLLWDIDGTVLDFLASESYAIKFLFNKFNIGICTDEMLKQYSEIKEKCTKMHSKNVCEFLKSPYLSDLCILKNVKVRKICLQKIDILGCFWTINVTVISFFFNVIN